jgi:hypothetical protein
MRRPRADRQARGKHHISLPNNTITNTSACSREKSVLVVALKVTFKDIVDILAQLTPDSPQWSQGG